MRCWIASDEICEALSETNVSNRLCWLNSRLRMAIIEQVFYFWPFEIGINHYQIAMAIIWTSEVHMYPVPWLLWSFRSENKCRRWFQYQCSFSLSSVSICEDWDKTLDCVLSLLWAGDLEIALKTEFWYVQRTHMPDKIKTQLTIARILNVYLSICCFILNFVYCWPFFSDGDTNPRCNVCYMFVGVNEGWSMIFHHLCKVRVMFKAVSICNWTEWPFRFTDTLSVWFGIEEKDCNRTICLFSFADCVYVATWVLFCIQVGCRISL